MRKVFLLITFLLCLNTEANECQVKNPATESSAEYLSKVAESLIHLKDQYRKFDDLDKKKDKDITAMMVVIKELRSGYNCSAEMIRSYNKSKNKNIADSSASLSDIYQFMADDAGTTIEEAKDKLDGKEEESLGDKVDKDSDRQIARSKKWEKLLPAISDAVLAAVDEPNPKTKKSDKLTISKSDRDSLVKDLKSQFKFPPKDDHIVIDEAAYFLYKLLSKPWKFK